MFGLGKKKVDANASNNRSKAVPFVAQLTPTDCGAACLSSVLAFHEKDVSIHKVRALLGGGRNGVTARQLLTAARQFGMRARGVGVAPDKLQFLPRGSILHWELNHFVVFEKLTKKGIQIMDPALGRREVKHEDVNKALSGVGIVLEPSETFVREKQSWGFRLQRYRQWIFSVKGVWGKVLLTSFFLQLLALSVPGLTGALIDKVVPRNDSQLLTLIGAAFVTLNSFYFLSTFLRSRLLLQLRTQVESKMSFSFVDHMLSLPYAFFQQRSAGDMMMRLSSQGAIRELLTTSTLSAILDGAMVSLYFILLVGAAPRLAMVALGLSVVQVIMYVVAGRKNRRLVVEGLASQSRLEGYQVEMLAGIETLKSMGACDRASARWGDLYVDVLNRSLIRGELDGTFSAMMSVLRFTGPAMLMIVGAFQVLDGTLTLGTMLGLSALGAGFLDPVANLVNTAMKLTQLKGYMERIEDVLDAPRERGAGTQNIGEPLVLQGAMRAHELCYRYPSEPKLTLENVSFEVQPGECIAIVGASGSGKSTLARVIAGLYEPSGGTIFYDEKDMQTLHLPSLRERLGIVTQDTRLFSGTLYDNVTMFEPSITRDEVQRACELASLHDDIALMPMGYDTVLADGGSSLSGGQRQRLSLARALVRKPSILILDEATSALDTVTEARVQAALRDLRCTRVIVAHRLSTIVEADKIIVMEQGHLMASGKHAELLTTSIVYQRLVRAQHEQTRAVMPLVAAPNPQPSGTPSRPVAAIAPVAQVAQGASRSAPPIAANAPIAGSNTQVTRSGTPSAPQTMRPMASQPARPISVQTVPMAAPMPSAAPASVPPPSAPTVPQARASLIVEVTPTPFTPARPPSVPPVAQAPASVVQSTPVVVQNTPKPSQPPKGPGTMVGYPAPGAPPPNSLRAKLEALTNKRNDD